MYVVLTPCNCIAKERAAVMRGLLAAARKSDDPRATRRFSESALALLPRESESESAGEAGEASETGKQVDERAETLAALSVGRQRPLAALEARLARDERARQRRAEYGGDREALLVEQTVFTLSQHRKRLGELASAYERQAFEFTAMSQDGAFPFTSDEGVTLRLRRYYAQHPKMAACHAMVAALAGSMARARILVAAAADAEAGERERVHITAARLLLAIEDGELERAEQLYVSLELDDELMPPRLATVFADAILSALNMQRSSADAVAFLLRLLARPELPTSSLNTTRDVLRGADEEDCAPLLRALASTIPPPFSEELADRLETALLHYHTVWASRPGRRRISLPVSTTVPLMRSILTLAVAELVMFFYLLFLI